VLQGHKTVALALSLSAPVNKAALHAAVPDVPVVEFTVETPDHALITCSEDLQVIRTTLRKIISELRDTSITRIELFPAALLSVCVEFGRMSLPKSDLEIRVWDYQNKATFIETNIIQ
jgi:SMODS-associated and fused to various effectors sensor domain